jgi:hypothetical protein
MHPPSERLDSSSATSAVATPVLRQAGHVRFSIHWSRVIPELCARHGPDQASYPATIKLIQRWSGRRTCERWRPGWSRYFSGKKLIAGRHDLKSCVEQPPQDDPGRSTRIHDDDRKSADPSRSSSTSCGVSSLIALGPASRNGRRRGASGATAEIQHPRQSPARSVPA